jgi:hypothetical protein
VLAADGEEVRHIKPGKRGVLERQSAAGLNLQRSTDIVAPKRGVPVKKLGCPVILCVAVDIEQKHADRQREKKGVQMLGLSKADRRSPIVKLTG